MRTVFPVPLPDIMAELTRAGRWEGELVHARRDGTTVVVASRWSLRRAAPGRPPAILETNNDITERKRAEDALHEARTELAHVARVTTLGELAASIAHEINQPLAAIVADANACLNWLGADRPPLDQVREALAAVVLLHYEAGRPRHGLVDQPLDHRGARGPHLGDREPCSRRHLPCGAPGSRLTRGRATRLCARSACR